MSPTPFAVGRRGPRSFIFSGVKRTILHLALLLGATALPAAAQTVPPGAPVDTLTVATPIGAGTVGTGWTLAAGDRVVVWPRNDVAVASPDAGGLPVPDAEPGAVVASFAGGRAFAWPERPVVWTAPSPGRLGFGLNGRAAHGLVGEARLLVARLTPEAAGAFPRPAIAIERAGGGVRIRWADRAGFGVDRRRIAFTLTTAHGTVYRLGAWGPVEAPGAILPLPPPVDLPPGVHTLSATITDRLGNVSFPSTITFDTGT